MLFYPSLHILLLSLNDIHRLIRIIEVIPTGTLMRWVAGPNHTELVDVLGLWSPYATVSPWHSTYISTAFFETLYRGANDSL